ncbi:MAG: hypothetical protein NTY19_49590 [Planctomycetota bacterium]|nr:hypothetical protein [Planctomycetota bacterium]
MNPPLAISRLTAITSLLGVWLATTVAPAQTAVIPRDKHAWGRFEVGAWTKVRKLTEEVNAQGSVTAVSTTETKTTLVELDDKGFVVQSEITVEVSGKRFLAQPKTVCLGYQGETSGEGNTLKKIGTEMFELGGLKTPCDRLEGTIGAGPSRAISVIYYSDRVAPYVLKREVKSVGSSPDLPPRQSSVADVIAVAMPYKVLAEIKTAAFIRTLQQHDKGTTVTVEVYCPDVPGGVVANTSKELNEAGRIVRRSTLELLDYGIGDDKDEAGRRVFLFHRKSPRRAVSPLPPGS